jgi:hypothetical protein
MIMSFAFGSVDGDEKKPAGTAGLGRWMEGSWRSLQLVREGRAAASRDRQRHQRAAGAAARFVEKERLFMAICGTSLSDAGESGKR